MTEQATARPKPPPRRLCPKPLSERTRARAAKKRAKPSVPVAPPPPGNGHAIRTAAQARGENLPEFPSTVAEIEAIVTADAPWIRRTDLPLLSVFCAELTVFRRAADCLAAMPPSVLMKKGSAQKIQVRRMRVLTETANALGLSAAGRYRLGLDEARTQRALRESVRPLRTEERAQAVAELLARSRALPVIELEPVAPSDGDSALPSDTALAVVPSEGASS